MNDKITYGDGWAIAILVAKELGIDVCMVDYANIFLETKKIHPASILVFEQEANKAIAEIVNRGLADKAQEVAERYYKLYKL